MASGNDRTVHYISQGSGPPVILVHGLASSWKDFTYLVPELASAGFSVYALDLLGHGDSVKPDDPEQYHVEQVYRHFQGWMDSLSFSEPVTLISHSLGGYLSLLHAIRRPEAVRRMVLIDPFYHKSQLSWVYRVASGQPQWIEKAMRNAPNWMVNAVIAFHPDIGVRSSLEIRQRIAADYKRASPHFAYIPRGIADLSGSLPQVTAPTLVIWGESDETLRPGSFPRLVRAMGTAYGQPIRGAGHQPHISKQELVNRMTLEFIKPSS